MKPLPPVTQCPPAVAAGAYRDPDETYIPHPDIIKPPFFDRRDHLPDDE